jgi:hypothetical protein
MSKLFKPIWEFAPDGIRYIIDSSKTAYSCARRPIALKKLCKLDVKVLHIVRDLNGVINSIMNKGLNRNLQNGIKQKAKLARLRSVIGWISANAAGNQLQKYFSKDDYLKIRYEDFILSPETTLKIIASFLSIDLSIVTNLLLNGKLESNSHQVAGNRMRYKRSIILKPDSIKIPSLFNDSIMSALNLFFERRYIKY